MGYQEQKLARRRGLNGTGVGGDRRSLEDTADTTINLRLNFFLCLHLLIKLAEPAELKQLKSVSPNLVLRYLGTVP